MRFPGKTAMITGAAGSLGRAVAGAFAAEGTTLALPVRTDEQADFLAASIHLPVDRVYTGIVNLSVEPAVDSFVDNVQKKFGGIHILINCAGGYAGGKPIEEVSLGEWDDLMKQNLQTAFLVCKAVLPGMKRAGWGRIVNIGAASALAPGARRGPYQVSKRGVITLTETIAEETRGSGITANTIAPTIIRTEANRLSMPDADSSRWVPPDQIAQCALYLCSDESASITGNTIRM